MLNDSGAVALEMSHLSKRYGNLEAVNDLNLVLKEGECFGFLGPNGAGKTTTISMITGLIKPDQGVIKVVGKVNRLDYLADVGFVPERPGFYENLTAHANLRYLSSLFGIHGSFACKAIDKALNEVGLLARANDRVGTFSHGMRQRLAIAQALVHKPRLLIMDEPTIGLDPQGAADIRGLIKSIHSNGSTIFISSHLLWEIEEICTHIGVINGGKLLAHSTIVDFKKRAMKDRGKIEFKPVFEDLSKALCIIRQLADIQEVIIDGDVLLITPSDNFSLENLNRLLLSSGIGIQSIGKHKLSLEDAYLSLFHEQEA